MALQPQRECGLPMLFGYTKPRPHDGRHDLYHIFLFRLLFLDIIFILFSHLNMHWPAFSRMLNSVVEFSSGSVLLLAIPSLLNDSRSESVFLLVIDPLCRVSLSLCMFFVFLFIPMDLPFALPGEIETRRHDNYQGGEGEQ